MPKAPRSNPSPVEAAEAPTPRAPKAAAEKAIAVALLKFPHDALCDVPGAVTASTVRHRDAHKQSRHTVDYLPSRRHFLVTYYPHTGDPTRAYVHETKPSYWLPLE